MAKAGFFHLGIGDLVRCFVCRVKFDNWEPEIDDPWKKHVEHSPSCLFVKLAKEEKDMTVEQFLEVCCGQALGKLDSFIENFERSLANN